MKLKAKHKGFTLIELLVVVAIIGILAATILASLGQARGKAKMARAQSEVSSMRAAAELAANGGVYPTTLFTDATSGMKNLVDSVTNAYTSALIVKAVISTGWAFEFNTSQGYYYCADSTGYSGKSSALINALDPKCTPTP